MDSILKGLGVALVTPFEDDGEVDYRALERLVDYVVEGGVNYLVALGTTAETPVLTPGERASVLSCIRERNAGRCPLVVGIGGNCTASVISDIRTMDLSGVTAILSVTPYYNRPSQRGLYEHYKAISSSSPVPVVLYNVPSRTGVNLQPDTVLRLAQECGNVMAVKEASGDIAQIERIVADRPAHFNVISGDDSLTLPVIERGGIGVISVAANAFPRQMSEMVSAALKGERSSAEEIWKQIAPAVKLLFVEGNPTGIKTALAVRGLIRNVLRLPLVEGSGTLYAELERAIANGRL